MSRRERAIEIVSQAIVVASAAPRGEPTIQRGNIARDDDLIDDLGLDTLELESLGLVLEEIFGGIAIDPEVLWKGPLYRSPEALADWCIRRADEAAWAESQRQSRRA